MNGFGFPKPGRLVRRKDFERILRAGRKLAGNKFVLWWGPGEKGRTPRLGVIVSGKIGGAVQRNRVKRLIREVFRLNRAVLSKGTDIIVYPRTCEALGEFDGVKNELFDIWRKAGLVQDDDGKVSA